MTCKNSINLKKYTKFKKIRTTSENNTNYKKLLKKKKIAK